MIFVLGLVTGILLIIIGTIMDRQERREREREFERRWGKRR